jgi:uncharacterized protein (TIGR03437 family)
VNILTPPDEIPGAVQVVAINGSARSSPFTVQAQALSPSFFVLNGGPYMVAQHSADNSLVGPASLYPGQTTPAKPGETVVLYAGGAAFLQFQEWSSNMYWRTDGEALQSGHGLLAECHYAE